MKIYHAPNTRGIRVIWICEELEVPYELETVSFSPEFRDSPKWRAISPTGKLPALEDDGLTMFESGAMVQYILNRYGNGRLAPKPGSAASGHHLQWCWFAEASLASWVEDFVYHTMIKPEAERLPAVVADARERARKSLDVVDAAVNGAQFLLGDEFTAADVMMGYTLMLTRHFKLLTDDHPHAAAYFHRLAARPGYQLASTA